MTLSPVNRPLRPAFQEKRRENGYPQIRSLYAILYVAITAIIMAYSGLFGVTPILLLYIIWLPHAYYKGRFILRLTSDIYALIGLSVLCVLSTFWSDYPSVTLKASLELASMILCTIIVARIVSMEDLIKGMILGLFLILIVPFRGGTYSIDGLFGSKNLVGYYAELGLYIAILYICPKKHRSKKILLCTFPIILFCACLYYGHSATALASFIATMIISCVAYFLARFRPRLRMPLLIAAIFCMGIFVVAAFYLGWQDAGLNALGKDATLTGRTYLWAQGLKFGMQSPIIGIGYDAFWVVGRPLAEKLWFEFLVFDRIGFHFHNMFINEFVELGLCGLLLIVYLYFKTYTKSLRFLVDRGANLETVFFVGIATMFFLRAFAEVDTTGPFGMGSLLFFAIIPRITDLSKIPPPENKAPVRKKLL